MRRRDLLALIGVAGLWPAASAAQQAGPTRRIGVLLSATEGDPSTLRLVAAFEQGLQERGWTVGRTVRIDYRWGASDAERRRRSAEELVELAPDVVLATAGSIVDAFQLVSRTVPIVFVLTVDPVGGGWVSSLAHPGGNATGFSAGEFSRNGKLLELLKEFAPGLTRVAVLRDPAVPAGSGGFAAIQTVAPSFGVQLTPVGVRDAGEIARAIGEFATAANGGLVVVGPPSSLANHFGLIVELAAKYRLPAIYPIRPFATAGGLMFYGPDTADQFHRAAEYVDRILKGEKPGDLPVQQPTKFELVINLKTARALGVTVPSPLLARASEAIE
ncbi:MAG TPA: ABC transporter substrate-binding protein [Stellaceae bacterium]|nr:ABC transporter substrate-binding protein [Stellaceae bacterium]